MNYKTINYKTMNYKTMNYKLLRRGFLTLTSLVLLFSLSLPADDAHSRRSAPPARIAYHYVGRVTLNFTNGTGVVYGYFTDLTGIANVGALFQGTPGETSALLTFRANIKFQALPVNGPLDPNQTQFAVTPVLVLPGTYQIYYGAMPAHNWGDPNTFSSGRAVATLARDLEQFAVLSTFTLNTGSATLQSTQPFSINGQIIDLDRIMPNGITDVTTGPAIPLTGSTPAATSFGFTGYGLAIGE
jgi:hypothetical protein